MSARFKVVVTDHGFPNLDQEHKVLDPECELISASCKTAEDVARVAADADALLVQWAPITEAVIGKLTRCKIIIRYGIGVDNVDLRAAKSRGIPVCNVPDYCIGEVADHTVALALALARQLPMIDRRVREGVWKIVPDKPMPAFREMIFATAGFGRIAQAVLERAAVFGFQRAACDPYIAEEFFKQRGVTRLSPDELFARADMLSLHSPLTPETKHFINDDRLRRMKPTAIVINTARGGLIDTSALARALQSGVIAGAGLDVFESEPLPADHPLRQCNNALLTSHVAWFSQSSVPKLQQLAAREALRGLKGEALQNQVNR
jgi:D-3-phosphoglycerate dehydrogenase